MYESKFPAVAHHIAYSAEVKIVTKYVMFVVAARPFPSAISYRLQGSSHAYLPKIIFKLGLRIQMETCCHRTGKSNGAHDGEDGIESIVAFPELEEASEPRKSQRNSTHTLLDMHERVRIPMLSTKFIAATPENTMQGLSVIPVGGCGIESNGWPGLFCAFENITTAVKIKDNDIIIMMTASTRI